MYIVFLPITKDKNVLLRTEEVLNDFRYFKDISKLAQECVKIPRPKNDCMQISLTEVLQVQFVKEGVSHRKLERKK